MDIQIKNGVGELLILNDDLLFFQKEEIKKEIIQQIVTMLNIRVGELKYNVNFGLSHIILWDTQADTLIIKEHIRNQILTFFSDYIKTITYVAMKIIEDENKRLYEIIIDLIFFDDESIKLKGVIING